MTEWRNRVERFLWWMVGVAVLIAVYATGYRIGKLDALWEFQMLGC